MRFHIPSLSIDDRIDALKETNPTKFKIYNFLWRTIWLGYWFYILLAIFIVISRFAPNFARHGGLIRGQYSIGYGAVIVIFLGSGLSMQTRDLVQNLFHWRAHLTVFLLEFLITSAIIFGFVCAVKSAHNPLISDWMLVGLIVTGCCPTTVSSNVVMTRKADGNVLLTLCEVFLGNLLGAFITPALVQMYCQGEWEFANPANGTSISDVYRNVMKQIGFCVFLPLFVGQVIQNVFPKETKWFLVTFKFNKVGSFMLLLIMFSSFSTAFYQKAFTSVSHQSIIFICFFSFGIYLFFTVLCYVLSRPYPVLYFFKTEPNESTSKFYNFMYKLIRPFYYNRADTVSVLLCGGAKTAALGVTLVSSQYGNNNPHLGELLVPVVLYQAIQVITAGLLTPFMKKWIHSGPEYKEKMRLQKEAEEEAGLSEDDLVHNEDDVIDDETIREGLSRKSSYHLNNHNNDIDIGEITLDPPDDYNEDDNIDTNLKNDSNISVKKDDEYTGDDSWNSNQNSSVKPSSSFNENI